MNAGDRGTDSEAVARFGDNPTVGTGAGVREHVMDLKVTRKDEPRGWHLVGAAGEIDIATAPTLEAALNAALDDGSERIAVDLSEVTFMDSTGLRSLISTQRRLEERGGSLAIVAPGGPARRLLEIAGVAGTLRLVESIDHLG